MMDSKTFTLKKIQFVKNLNGYSMSLVFLINYNSDLQQRESIGKYIYSQLFNNN